MLQRLMAEGIIPVVATIGADETVQAYNINADTVAGALAEALGAAKLIFLTDVAGLRVDHDDPSTLIHQASLDVVDEILRGSGAVGGMKPKIEACAQAVRGGVDRAHILDGRVPHALLLELFTDSGVGTMVLADAVLASWLSAHGLSRAGVDPQSDPRIVHLVVTRQEPPGAETGGLFLSRAS
jgi:acetylglutamate kinase